MVTLIGVVGTSPMVITEMLDELKKLGITVGRVVLLVTESQLVRTAFYALALDLRWSYGIEAEKIDLPFEDIKSQQDHDEFVKIAKRVIEEKKKKDRVVVSVAGGRKTMSVGMYKAAVESGVKEIYHVIAEEVPGTHMGPLSLLKEHATVDLESIYRGDVEAPESLKTRIVEEFHRPYTVHLIKV